MKSLHLPALLSPSVGLLVGALASTGCSAIYPELGTRTRPAMEGMALDPPPPEELHWMRFVSAHVPAKTRDGREWSGGKGADTYAKLYLNGVDVMQTHTQSGTLAPTWPKSPHGNLKIARTDRLRVELWSSKTLHDAPICAEDVGYPSEEQIAERAIRVECEAGAEVVLAFEPAHAIRGAGLWYELRTDSAFVTRTIEGSPAHRIGLEAGDEILQLGGRDVSKLGLDAVRSAFNAIPLQGLELVVAKPGSPKRNLTLKEGPIYPELTQYGQVD